MNLNLHTDYALRILMALAAGNRQMSVDKVASSYGISRNHLAKVAQRLQSLGYIDTVRGRGGGMTLALPPEKVNVGKIVRALENMEGFVSCMGSGASGCKVDGVCGLKGALGAAINDFLARLDSYTLADIVPKPNAFLVRLQNRKA